MDGSASQQQLLSNSPSEIEITDETPLTDQQPEENEAASAAEQKATEWTTSKISEICREGDIEQVRELIEFSKQNGYCAKNASEMVDRVEPETGLSPLHQAARYQQLDVCLMLLSNLTLEHSVNIKDVNGQTPMHSVFRSSHRIHSHAREQLKLDEDLGNKIQESNAWKEEYENKILPSDHPLIYLFARANGNVNAPDKYSITPLHYATAHGRLAGVKQLITFKAEIEAKDRQGLRPLHLASKHGCSSTAEYLLEHNAEIDAMDADRWTPLHHACSKGHLNIIELIESKAGTRFQKLLEMRTVENTSCLHLAVQHGNTQTVRYILKDFPDKALKRVVNEQIEPYGTSLHLAAKFCDPSMIDLLHSYGADLLILNSQGQSALHIASASNRLPIVKKLLSLSPSSLLEIKDDHGRTALSVAANAEIVDELLTFHPDIASLDNNKMNALMTAVLKGHRTIVEHLLPVVEHQSVKIFDQVTKKNKRSIFLIAVKTGSIDMCKLLLDNPHIRWNTTDKQGMNAFHIAARNNHHELIGYLAKLLQKSDTLASVTSRSYSVTATAEPGLINVSQSPTLHLHIDAQNDEGKTPLHLAAEEGYTPSVEILLKSGADVLLTNSLGQLALHSAIQNGHCQCVELIIKYSVQNMADFRAVLSRRQSPLITACQMGFVDIVQLLLSQNIGIDIGMDFEHHQEENPIEVAIQYRQADVLYALLEHPDREHWLMPVRKTKENFHQTPLREMIRHMPECARYAFDKLISKTNEFDEDGNPFQRTTYNYQYIDDYFAPDGVLYATKSRELYRNHPFIIALDNDRHFLLEHPLARQLISQKLKLYRSFFYSSRLLNLLLLLILTFHVLILPAPISKSSTTKIDLFSSLIQRSILPTRLVIIVFAGLNLLKVIGEIIFYRGLRVPFAQIFSMIAFSTTIIAFIPYRKGSEMISWQWELAAFSTLFHWFYMAFILRSVPSVGNIIFLFRSILTHFTSLTIVALPLLIGFTLATKMLFYNQSSFLTTVVSIHKLSAMLIGEFGYETLFYSKPTFTAASLLFIPFIIIMTIVFMNLLLGLTVGDIQTSVESAKGIAKSYQTRELIYIESIVLTTPWFKTRATKARDSKQHSEDSILNKSNEETENEADYNESLLHRQRQTEFGKALDILNMLCTQAKQALEKEINFETTLKQLLTARKQQISSQSSADDLNISR